MPPTTATKTTTCRRVENRSMSLAFALDQVMQRAWEPIELPAPVALEALPTPALVLDEAAFKRNLQRMQSFQDAHAMGVRPHAKTHKCPIVAKRQLDNGAVGVCAAKLSEAAALVAAGIEDVLITSPIVTPAKLELLAELATRASGLKIVVDSDLGLNGLLESGARLGVLVDIDVAMGRTGTRDSETVVRLADTAAQSDALEFLGVQHYAGHVMHVAGFDARRTASLELWSGLEATLDGLVKHGLEASIVTGGGTGTYNIDCDVPFVTDLQVGSYVFMDHEYRVIGGEASEVFDDFEVSLTVLTTVISEPVPGRAVTVDGGFKVFASDTVEPQPLDLAGAKFRFGGDEHGILILDKGVQQPLLGGVQRFVTPHCDPTVNLHDHYWVEDEDGMVRTVWPVTARGCSW